MRVSSLTVPLAIFANRLPGSSVSTAESLLDSQAICDYQTIIVAKLPGLSVDDLYSLPRTSAFAQQFNQASLHSVSSSQEYDDVLASISQRCALPVVESRESSKGGLTSLILPDIDEEQFSYRRDVISSTLDSMMKEIATDASLAVIITGASTSSSPRLSIQRRSMPESPFFSPQIRAPKNGTLTRSKGLLHEYQFLTPGLLLTTIISLLVLFPILWFGITALSSIEIPSGMGNIAKTEKKA